MDRFVRLRVFVNALIFSVVSLHVNAESATENSTKSTGAGGLRSDGELVQANKLPVLPVDISKNATSNSKAKDDSENQYGVVLKDVMVTGFSTSGSAESNDDLQLKSKGH